MDVAAIADDRLPWLDTPRPAPHPPAARSTRAPLLVLLALFLAGGVAIIAFLAGRSTAPEATPAPPVVVGDRAPIARIEYPAPVPVPAAPVLPPAPPAATPTASAGAKRAAAPAKRIAERPQPSVSKAIERTSEAGARRDPQISHAEPVAGPPTAWSERPFAGAPGRIIQLGTYATQAEADSAWWRLARSYPYLATLPRVVTPIAPAPGAAPAYQVRLSVGSRREARSLCENLHRNRRGCVIDWSQK